MTRPFKIAVSGATGFVASALIPFLKSAGHVVMPLGRAFFANPDPGTLAGVDAVVHLAGENISAGRWTRAKKERIYHSRIDTTRQLSGAMAQLPKPSKVLICASAVGIYGDRGDEELAEDSTLGSGFLARVVRDWETACEPAREAGVRVVNVRFGMILSPEGGALAKMLPLFKLGLGGPLGSGKQWVSWVALQDVIGAIQFAIAHEELHGPVNVVAPAPIRNADFARTLGRVLHRSAFLTAPAFALRLAMGEMADELLLAGQRVIPNVLQKSGFRFQFPELEAALNEMMSTQTLQAP